MNWLRSIDLPRRFGHVLPAFVIEALVALAATGAAVGARLIIDALVPGVVEFTLIFPAVAAATLVAGPRSGIMVIALAQSLVWYFILPVKGSFRFASAGDAVSLSLSTVAESLLLVFVASYRSAAADAVALQEARSEALQRSVEALEAQARAVAALNLRDESLRQTRQNLLAIYEASADGLTLCRAVRDEAGAVFDYRILEANRAHEELTGAPRAQVLEHSLRELGAPADDRWIKSVDAALRTGDMQQFDVQSADTGLWLNVRVSPVSGDLFQQTFVDVTDRHRLDEQRQRLLQEMSHRVANNLQMMASFLHAQAGLAEPESQVHLKTAESRVQVLGRLHSLLAYPGCDRRVNAADYIKELCEQLAATIDRPGDVSLTTEVEPLELDADKIVALGFIINELVTNALKYAFPPPAAGGVVVRLAPSGADWILEVGDDGVGLPPPGAQPGERRGLGAKLVDTFVAQMGGALTTTSGPGVRHKIRFTP